MRFPVHRQRRTRARSPNDRARRPWRRRSWPSASALATGAHWLRRWRRCGLRGRLRLGCRRGCRLRGWRGRRSGRVCRLGTLSLSLLYDRSFSLRRGFGFGRCLDRSLLLDEHRLRRWHGDRCRCRRRRRCRCSGRGGNGACRRDGGGNGSRRIGRFNRNRFCDVGDDCRRLNGRRRRHFGRRSETGNP